MESMALRPRRLLECRAGEPSESAPEVVVVSALETGGLGGNDICGALIGRCSGWAWGFRSEAKYSPPSLISRQ